MESVVPDPFHRLNVVTVALLNNEVAGAVVGLFGLVFNPVRSVLQAIAASEAIVTSAAESRVSCIGVCSRLTVTV